MARVLWVNTVGLLDAVRCGFSYGPGEDRATGYVYPPWPAPLAELGALALYEVERLACRRFSIVAFQAYRNGAGCQRHTDDPFGDQVILSLGTTRSFWLADETVTVCDGDLVFVPQGVEHGLPEEDVPGERCSLVFRNPT